MRNETPISPDSTYKLTDRPLSWSAVVLARNEEANLPRCLAALGFARDTVVVDDFSEDATREAAEECGARVLRHKFVSFADQRNWTMEHVAPETEWILHLDADEVVTPALAAQIQEAIAHATPDVAGFMLCFKTMFQGRWLRYSSTFPVWILRLVRRGRVVYKSSGHGETYEADGKIGRIEEPFLHYNFSKGLSEWFAKHNVYSDREAAALLAGAGSVNRDDLMSEDPIRRRKVLKKLSYRLPLHPWLKFLYMYILRGGFLDGRAGLTYCTLQAIYDYMIGLKIKESQSQ